MTQWQFSDAAQQTVFMANDDGSSTSLSIDDPIIVQYLADGNTILDIPLQQAIDEKCSDVNDFRDIVLNAGFTWNGNIYDTGSISLMNITATVAAINSGVTIPSNFTWRTQDNQNVGMTAQQFVTFALSTFAWGEGVYIVSWTHKASIQALTTVADVTAYDFTTGWPPN